ncbi:hypothetical protein TIFTF001_031302 [Ficus carica]|uniref:Uncharacterized protein n=1 Tax=Ficus carica TaxID=3494 RepID=A0AA88DWN6_FICCA|nr:hypothetical protein TIFTF001_031302 [Ficus carica]
MVGGGGVLRREGLVGGGVVLAGASTSTGLGSGPSQRSGREGLIVWRVARCGQTRSRVGWDLASGSIGMLVKDSTSAGVVRRLGGRGLSRGAVVLVGASTPVGLGSGPSPRSGREGLIVWRVAHCEQTGSLVGWDLASGSIGMLVKDSTSAGVVRRLGAFLGGRGLSRGAVVLAEASTPAGLGSGPSPRSGREGLIVWRVARCEQTGSQVGWDLASGSIGMLVKDSTSAGVVRRLGPRSQVGSDLAGRWGDLMLAGLGGGRSPTSAGERLVV